jgi:hypothetical protein
MKQKTTTLVFASLYDLCWFCVSIMQITNTYTIHGMKRMTQLLNIQNYICVACVFSLILQQFMFIYFLLFSFISKILKIINIIKSGIFQFQFCIFNSCHCAKIVGKIYYCYCFNLTSH